jgi:serine/threonine protein kinase/Tol biopolymer transport system component
MTPERWQHVKALLQAALERKPVERTPFLDEACANDPSLRAEVQSLLASFEQAGGFIESPAVEVMAESLTNGVLAVGSSFGPYQILDRLGSGGMGEVYLAEDSRLGRKVALKVLPAHFTTDKERLRRFQQEARAASALNHPNILTIYEIGEVDSRHFIANEFIEGVTLRQHLIKVQLKITDALEIVTQVASALLAAHEAGIVHRDIKPENIMVRGDNIVKVLDFGLAKLTERTSITSDFPTLIETEKGIIMGTPFYMSPEQARGFAVDARSDIWSMAVVLYEMVSGRLPFEGATGSDVIVSILDREPKTLLRYSPDIPSELEWIITKALRKDRDERYQTIRELLTDLKGLKRKLEFEEHVPKEEFQRAEVQQEINSIETKNRAAAFGTQETAVPFWWSRRVMKIVALLSAVLILATGGYFLLKYLGALTKTPPLRNLTFNQLTFEPGAEFFPTLSPDGKMVAYASAATGNWDIYLQRVGGSNPINLTRDSPADDSQPAFSPDGESIAFRSEREGGGVYLMGATGESVIRISEFGYSPSWSPDGEQILIGTERVPQPSIRPTISQLWRIDVRNRERHLLSQGDALQPIYSPNKQRIAYWSRPNTAGQREEIWTIPANGGQAVAVTNGSTTDLNPIWSPDGNYLYFSSNRGGSFNVWRVAIDESTGVTAGEPEAVTTVGAATAVVQLAFSRDGLRLAYSAQEEVRNLRKAAFDAATGKVSQAVAITEGTRQLWFPDPSPDGEWLTCYSMGQQRHIFIMRTDGSDQRDFTADNHRDFWPRWSPDGKRIAFSSRRTGNYELWLINRDGSGLQQLTSGHQSPGAHYSTWSPDGSRIAYSIHKPANDCLIFEPGKPWSEQKPEAITPLPDASISFEGWSWSADGKKLAGIKHLPSGLHTGIGVYDFESKTYDWITDFGDWPIWLKDNQRLLFVSQGKIYLFDLRSRKYQPVLTVTDQDVDIGSPALSHDNRVLYFSFVETQADIWLMDLR